MGRFSLFPDTKSTQLGPAGYSDDDYSFLQQSASPVEKRVRDLLEGWFRRYPRDHKKEFLARFRSNDLFGLLSPFFELYIHEMLIRLEAQAITLHPQASSTKRGRPEFHVIERDGGQSYVEATTATGLTEARVGALKMEQVVYDKINTVRSSDFFIGMDIKGAPKRAPSAKKLVSKLQRWLDGLDYDEIVDLVTRDNHDSLPRFKYSSGDGWEIEFFPIPKDPSRRVDTVRPIGMQWSGLKPNNRVANIRDKILAKARYYDPEGPFVLAVNCLEMFSPNNDDIWEILFGDLRIDRVKQEDGTWKSIPARQMNGVWTEERGPRYQRLSAVLFCFKINPWSIANHEVLLFHNPWASRSYEGVLNRLTHARTKIENVEGQHQFYAMQGLHPRNIFGLPERWPELD